AIAGTLIAAVGPYERLRAEFPEAGVVGDGTGILTPGLVSTHGHFSEGLVTGIGETHTLWEWFVHVTGPIEAHLTCELAYVGTLLKGAEMALSGVTTTADMFCHAPGPEPSTPGVVQALAELGLRGDVSYGAQDDSNPRPLELVLAEHEALRAAAAASERCRFRVGLATVPAASDELIGATVELLRETPRLHVHLHEVREEVTHSRSTRGVGSVEYAARAGLLDAQVVAAHCVWLNDSQDMLQTMKVAALLQKVHHLQATAMTAPQVLELATIGGARALGLDAEVGSLEPGKQADLVLFAEASPSLSNVHDPYQELVYCASPRDVHTVWVAGTPVVSEGRVLGVDLAELLPRARELAVKLAVDAGLDSELAREAAAPD